MNDQLISELGVFCKDLLGSEPFQALVQLYSQQCAADILQSKPDDKASREQTYAAYLGFEGFLALAKKFGDAAEAQVNPPEPEDTTDDPRVHDIYEMN